MKKKEKENIYKCIQLNKSLLDFGLTKLTWGNASILSDKKVYIKSSGVPFFDMDINSISIINLYTNKTFGLKKPSVDAPIHIAIYEAFPNIKSIIHTHSKYATIWSQCNKPIPILGTTHADCFPDDIPIIELPKDFDFNNYENNLGKLIVNFLNNQKLNPALIKAVLLAGHGPFIFSDDTDKILEYAITLEYIAEIAMYCSILKVHDFHLINNINLFDKHFKRKNGENKYYGQ